MPGKVRESIWARGVCQGEIASLRLLRGPSGPALSLIWCGYQDAAPAVVAQACAEGRRKTALGQEMFLVIVGGWAWGQDERVESRAVESHLLSCVVAGHVLMALLGRDLTRPRYI